MKSSKIVAIIGAGHVGAGIAYSIAVQGIAKKVLLIDKDKQKAISQSMDIADGLFCVEKRAEVEPASLADLSAADIVLNCAGDSVLLKGHNRKDELEQSIKIADSIADGLSKANFRGVLINVANPCDLVTARIAHKMKLPRGRVFGTGTALDSARLAALMVNGYGLSKKEVSAYVLGEHGTAQVIPWTCCRPRDKPSAGSREYVEGIIKNRAWAIYAGKQCTEYGIATVAADIVKAVLNDEKREIVCSCEVAGEYGQSGLFAGFPAMIGAGGVERIVELPLNGNERTKLRTICETMKKEQKEINND